jgi:hypothetical protein
MDRDTIQNFDTIDAGPDGPEFERHDTEVVTEQLTGVDEEDLEPTVQTSVRGSLHLYEGRASDPLIPPPAL